MHQQYSLIDSIYKKDENYCTKMFLEIYYFIEDKEILILIYSTSDEEYYDECINWFLETLKKIRIFFSLEL